MHYVLGVDNNYQDDIYSAMIRTTRSLQEYGKSMNILSAEPLSDLRPSVISDYADDAVLLAQRFEVLDLALEIMQDEASPFGLEISWTKTKIQAVCVDDLPVSAEIAGNDVEVVHTFTYLGVLVPSTYTGGSEPEISRWTVMTDDVKDCVHALQVATKNMANQYSVKHKD